MVYHIKRLAYILRWDISQSFSYPKQRNLRFDGESQTTTRWLHLMQRKYLEVNSVKLAYIDFGGTGPLCVLLHGLYGRATTWSSTASWLTKHYHVIGLDQRGHGWSDKPNHAYTRDHYVNDIAAVIQTLSSKPALIIGHSMGALNAWVTAARFPELVSGLVLEDMSASTAIPSPGAYVKDWLDEWPLPFPTMLAVRSYFDGIRPGLADYFIEVMIEKEDGYYPLFQPEHMIESAIDWGKQDHWQEIDKVQCPTLVVKGSESSYSREELREMANRIPQGQYVEIAHANHVVHYDQPEEWHKVVEQFVVSLKDNSLQ